MKIKRLELFTKENNIKLISFILFVLHTFYVSYPDEFVNLLGGLSILQGKTPYKEFFDHHMPGAWYLSALLLIISGKSFLIFRILWAFAQFFFLILIGRFVKQISKAIYNYFLIFLILYPLTSLFFWTHLYLADSLAGLVGAGVLWISFTASLEKKFPLKIALINSLLLFFIVFTSLTYVYFAGIIYLWNFYLLYKYNNEEKKLKKFFIFSSVPYIFYGLYLFLSNSFQEFWFANFVYNTKLYISIPNYTRGQHFNPLKMFLTLIFNFHHHFWPALNRIGSLDFYLPIIQTFTLAIVLLLIIFSKINYIYGILYFFLFSLSAPRSNIENLKETDYQSAMFVVVGLTSVVLFFYLYKKFSFKEKLLNLTFNAAAVLLLIYSFFTFVFLSKNSYEKLFYIYTQKMPRIYDKSYPAEFVDSLLNKGDYFWMGPYEPHHLFFIKKGKLPGKYPTLLPQFRENEYLKNSFLTQFRKHPPKIIIFKHTASIFMTPANEFGKFFLEFLKKDYIPISKLKNVKVLKSPSEFDLREDLYIHKKYLKEMLDKLKILGYIN